MIEYRKCSEGIIHHDLCPCRSKLESSLAAKDAEIERLLECQKSSNEIASELVKNLSLAESRNAKMREAGEKLKDLAQCYINVVSDRFGTSRKAIKEWDETLAEEGK